MANWRQGFPLERWHLRHWRRTSRWHQRVQRLITPLQLLVRFQQLLGPRVSRHRRELVPRLRTWTCQMQVVPPAVSRRLAVRLA